MIFGTTRNMSIAPLAFVVDLNSLGRTTGKQVDWNLVTDRYRRGAVAVTSNGGAAAAATALPVDPIPVAIKKGTILKSGAGEFAQLTADAAVGAVSLAVEALPQAIEDNDVFWYTETRSQTGLVIPAGTVMCELANGKVVPRAIAPGAETAFGILETNAMSDAASDSLTGYSVLVKGIFFENMLPDSRGNGGVLPAGYITELRARGGSYVFRVWRDDRGA